jgi:leucyl-tRNA synthetase
VLRFGTATLVSLVQPFAPHVAEELWARLGGERLWRSPWPAADGRVLARDTFTLVVQVNGKVRDRVEVPVDLPREELVRRARELERVRPYLGDGATVRKEIVVPGKLVNLVVG